MSSVSKQKRQAKKGTVKPAEKPITNGTAPATNGLAENGEAGDSAGCCSIKETVVKDKLGEYTQIYNNYCHDTSSFSRYIKA